MTKAIGPVDGTNLSLFEIKPIKFAGGIVLSATGAAIGNATKDQWAGAIQYAVASAKCSPYWIWDLLRYADKFPAWAPFVAEVCEGLDISDKTQRNLRSLAGKVDIPERELAPSPSHAATVAGLEVDEQRALLELARTERLTVPQLRDKVASGKRKQVIAGQVIAQGRYRVVTLDPVWHIDGNPSIEALPIPAYGLADFVVGLWVPDPVLDAAFAVLRSWGLKYQASLVWDAVLLADYGPYMRTKHEHLLLATRGHCPIDPDGHPGDTVITIRRTGPRHPEEFAQILERMYPSGPYLELCGAQPRTGWTVFGDDPKEWGK
jgi:N6-adenosine-specific RNA methylase IME4